MKNYKSYRAILKDIYSKRKKNNPSYSISAFSRDAGFKSYHMSDVLADRYGLSIKRSVQVADCLKIKGLLRERFLLLVVVEHARSPRDKKDAKLRLKKLHYSADLFIKESGFKLINNWYDAAIIVLATTKNYSFSIEKVAQELGLSQEEVQHSLDTMSSLGIMNEKRAVDSHQLAEVVSKGKSEALQEFHRQNLDKATSSIKEVDFSKRSLVSYTSLLNKNQYARIATLIDETIKNALVEIDVENSKIESLDDCRVYSISSQVFPLNKD